MKRAVFLVVFCLWAFAPLAAAGQAKTVASGVRYEPIGDYGTQRLDDILTREAAAFSTFPVSYPPAQNAVRLYKVTYPTTIPERGGKPVTASGLVAVPQVAAKKLPLVSYQHGTVFTKTAVPSRPEESPETRLAVARLAGQGYVVIGADYVGKGDSDEPDSYMVRDVTVQACLDMLRAARAVLADLGVEPDKLFLSGWSQGAWSTMQFRHALEAFGMPVAAAAVAATPSDLYALVTRWIENPTSLDATYLVGIVALFVHSYAGYYGLPGLPSVAIRPEYQETARLFYENRIDWATATKVLPETVPALLQPAFAGESSLGLAPLYRKFQDNQAYRWRSTTPTRYYYGKRDEVMPPYIATLPVEYTQILGGAAAEGVCAGDTADHRGAFLFGLRDQKEFFDSLR